jgi:hypothetical protein
MFVGALITPGAGQDQALLPRESRGQRHFRQAKRDDALRLD